MGSCVKTSIRLANRGPGTVFYLWLSTVSANETRHNIPWGLFSLSDIIFSHWWKTRPWNNYARQVTPKNPYLWETMCWIIKYISRVRYSLQNVCKLFKTTSIPRVYPPKYCEQASLRTLTYPCIHQHILLLGAAYPADVIPSNGTHRLSGTTLRASRR